MFAQSLGEYGAQSGSVSTTLQRLTDTISTATPGTWLVIGGIAVAAFWIWSRLKR